MSLFAAKGRCDHFHQNGIFRYVRIDSKIETGMSDTRGFLHCFRLLFDEIPNEGESFADGLVPEKA